MKDVEQCLFTTYEEKGVYQIQCSGLVPGPGHVYCTLIVGKEYAILIDNGFGDDDFWPHLRTLTEKPVIAAATHVHPDHTSGSGAFEEIWIGRGDEQMLKAVYGEEAYDAEKKLLFGRTKVRFLSDNQVFDLGGRSVKALHTPGHTWGSFCFHDSKSNLMIMGDTMNQRVFLQCAKPPVPLKRYRKSLCMVMDYDFEKFLGGHHPEPFGRSHIEHMLQMIDSFSLEKGKPYVREGMEGVSMYVEGRGYGDPDYCGFMFNQSDLEEFLR